MKKNYSIIRYQFGSGELELGGRPFLKPKVALETVMMEDFLWENRLKFTNASEDTEFKTEYMWIPASDGVVTVFKLGYVHVTKVKSGYWDVRKKTDFPYCVVVLSTDDTSPFILVYGYDKAFKDATEVMGILSHAINGSFHGRGLSISLTLCDKNDQEAEDWATYMFKVYKKARQHKDATLKALRGYREKKKGKTHDDFRECVVNHEKADAIITLIRKYMKGKTEPMDIMMPLAAAKAAGVISRPKWPATSKLFHLKDSLYSSFFRLTAYGCKTYQKNESFTMMVSKFKDL